MEKDFSHNDYRIEDLVTRIIGLRQAKQFEPFTPTSSVTFGLSLTEIAEKILSLSRRR